MTAAPLPPLVVTGATGFVGGRVLQVLLADHERRSAHRGWAPRLVTLIARNPDSPTLPSPLPAGWRVVTCDLATDAPPPGTIAAGSVVLHLAAATGRVSEPELRAMNVDGTQRLLEAAAKVGAAHVVFVSSIAAGFSDRRWYPYAASKLEGERLVAASGLRVTTVRPTMVFGPGSPVQEGLQRLALGAAPIVLGSGSVAVQPVHVDDLAFLLVQLASPPTGDSARETALVHVAGPNRLTMRELLARMRSAHGLRARTLWPVPLALPRRLLALAERAIGARLPVTAGQLASFVNDSSAGIDPLVQRLLPAPRSLDVMLDAGTRGQGSSGANAAVDRRGASASFASAPDAPDASDAPDAPDAPDAIEREFAVFARYLGTASPAGRATGAYLRSHRSAAQPTGDPFDRWLVAVARSSVVGCGLADAYARRVRPYGLLRRRLVLALAVLEASPDVHARYDTARPSAPLVAWVLITVAGLGWLTRTVVATVLLAPLQLAARFAPARAADD